MWSCIILVSMAEYFSCQPWSKKGRIPRDVLGSQSWKRMSMAQKQREGNMAEIMGFLWFSCKRQTSVLLANPLLPSQPQPFLKQATLFIRPMWQRVEGSLQPIASKELRPSGHQPTKKQSLLRKMWAWKSILLQLSLKMTTVWSTPWWQPVRNPETEDPCKPCLDPLTHRNSDK